MKRALLISVGTLLLPTLALAQGAPGGEPAAGAQAGLDPNAPPGVHVVDDTEPKTPLVAPARDLLGAHLLVAGAVGPAWSLGKLGSDVASARGLGSGLGLRADVGVGVSRSLVLGVWGTFATYAHGDTCGVSCSGQAFGIGPFLRYHLSQGLRFDPWMTLGTGFRRVSFDDALGTRQKFSGLEWLHFELGADYYLFSGLGFGPYGALGLSTYTKRSPGAGDAAVNTELSVGLRFLFDAPGR